MGTHAFASRTAPPAAVTSLETKETRDVLDGIRRIIQGLRASSRAVERRVGLSAPQLFVLLKLSGEQGLSINDLAARTLTHQSSVSVVVSRLVEQGLVSRHRSADDGRRVELALTRKGRAVLARAPQAAQERLIAAIGSLPAADRRSLARSLQRLGIALSAKNPPSMFFEDEPEPADRARRIRR